ncbi:hypothetical protein QL285_081366 [Trifolium repens]|nr:hypothetical protein QL285_081366 [Trifolium repens]
MLVRETVTTWDFVDRLLLTAWSLDPASGTTSYHGRVRIITSRGTFPVPLHVLLGVFWTAPVGPQSGAQGVTGVEGSVSGEICFFNNFSVRNTTQKSKLFYNHGTMAAVACSHDYELYKPSMLIHSGDKYGRVAARG